VESCCGLSERGLHGGCAAIVALLTPAWLASEWIDATEHFARAETILGQAVLLLSITYLSALFAEQRGSTRRVLVGIGEIALIPAAIIAVPQTFWSSYGADLPLRLVIIGKVLGYVLSLLLAMWLRRKAAWMNVLAAAWVFTLGLISPQAKLAPYLWCAVSSLALIAWGLKELRRERINLGIAGFGITVMTFYFSNVMDKLGRSASLIGLGLYFL
jgi:hypothetical protein